MIFSAFNTTTGEFIQLMDIPEEAKTLQESATVELYAGDYSLYRIIGGNLTYIGPRPSDLYHCDTGTNTWVIDNSLKPYVWQSKVQQLEQEVAIYLQDNIEFPTYGNPSVTSIYKAGDEVKLRLSRLAQMSTSGITTLTIFDEFDEPQSVDLTWLADFYTSIVARDENLYEQLALAKIAVKALLDDSGSTAQDIVEYFPTFVIPTYPYY